MALTQDRNTHMKGRDLVVVGVAASTVIYAGSLVVVDSGYAKPGETATGLTYIGRADEMVDNSAGANGDQSVTVRRNQAFKWENLPGDPITEADLFSQCYIVDDETVAKTDGTGTRSVAGTVVAVDSDGVWVE